MPHSIHISKDELVDIALSIFSQHGYKKTTLKDIADAAGISTAALYRYILDKQELYDAAAHRGLSRWQRSVFDAVNGGSGTLAKFTILCEKGFSYLATDEEFRRLLENDPGIFPLFTGDHFVSINNASREMLKSIIKQGIEDGIFREIDLEERAGSSSHFIK